MNTLADAVIRFENLNSGSYKSTENERGIVIDSLMIQSLRDIFERHPIMGFVLCKSLFTNKNSQYHDGMFHISVIGLMTSYCEENVKIASQTANELLELIENRTIEFDSCDNAVQSGIKAALITVLLFTDQKATEKWLDILIEKQVNKKQFLVFCMTCFRPKTKERLMNQCLLLKYLIKYDMILDNGTKSGKVYNEIKQLFNLPYRYTDRNENQIESMGSVSSEK